MPITDADRNVLLIDAAETTRTHPIRTIEAVLPLLDDALNALDNNNPEVVREFLERTRDALVAEDKWLRRRDHVR